MEQLVFGSYSILYEGLPQARALVSEWVQALRSGDYAQGRDQLRTDRGYCCLGVLCDLQEVGQWERLSDYDYQFVVQEDGNSVNDVGLPGWLAKQIDLDTFLVYQDGVELVNPFSIKHLEQFLVHLNDEVEATFSDIASFLEELYDLS